MATLDPKLNSGIGYEQPVATPSALGAISGLASTFVRAAPASQGPSAADLKSAALDPFAKRIFDLKNSNLSDAQFKRTANSLVRQAIAVNPEYTPDYLKITREGYGVTEEVLETPPEDVLTAGRNAYAESIEGQSDMRRAVTLDKEGYLDDEATQSKFAEYYADSISEKAAIERSSRKLQASQNDLNQWKTDSELSMNSFTPRWTKKSQDVVDSLITQALSGAEVVDTPEEQLAYLRQAKRALTDEYRAKAQAAGIHPDVYSAQLGEAVAPIENLLATAIATGEDSELMLNAFTNANRLQAEKALHDALGVWSGSPEFVKQAMSTLGSQLYDADTFKKVVNSLTEDANSGRTSGLNFLPNIPSTPKAASTAPSVVDDTALSDMRRKSAEDKGYVDDTLTSASSEIKTYKDLATDYEREGVFRAFSKAVAVSEVSSAPLGNAYLHELLTNNIRTYSTIVQGNDEVAVDLKNSLAYFSSKQIGRNQAIISNSLSFMKGYGVKMVGSRLVLTYQGVGQGKPSNLSGLGKDQADLYRSIENINIINSAMSRMKELEEVTTDVTNGKLMPDTGQEGDIQRYLDSIQGGDGDGPQGGTGTDRLVSLIDRTEGGGDYDTLFSFSNRAGKTFEGVNVSTMTLGELSDFSQGVYADWSKQKLGKVATPMGKYQIVGTTLRQLQKEMGLPNNIVFTASVQDAMFHHLARKAVSGKSSASAKRSALRGTWEGFKSISDKELDLAISEFEGSTPPTLEVIQADRANTQLAPVDTNRPVARPVDLGGTDLAPVGSPRPQGRPTGAPEGTTEEAARVSGGEGASRGAEASKERAERVWAKLSNQTKTMLTRLLGDEEVIKEALASGELDEKDIPDGE